MPASSFAKEDYPTFLFFLNSDGDPEFLLTGKSLIVPGFLFFAVLSGSGVSSAYQSRVETGNRQEIISCFKTLSENLKFST